ncbi:hypothetical protein PISMIDRAFT_577074 [Pisolithus microcarpus 441]|uniref:Unplaced genomic scaffold scaffold_767, whole genome shotgun sequence n=1 Tax=Pisolithus microcarpus 441 TaxID=765257 RepID=A0A0C9YK47_9AGAM|nr:hypothetical protein BKA83DRAFT_577074 [Pisolithus microcarpus]KIK10742.1 hypothetical protein PISMIDRAFT_577074 [Pisolithus microcarpus 441]
MKGTSFILERQFKWNPLWHINISLANQRVVFMQLQANVAKPRRDVGELLKLCAVLGTSQLWNTHERNRETTWLVILCVACIAMAALLASMIASAPRIVHIILW